MNGWYSPPLILSNGELLEVSGRADFGELEFSVARRRRTRPASGAAK